MDKNSPIAILVHCTDLSYKQLSDQLVACNGWHKDRGFPLSKLNWYVGYHRLITGDRNYKTREDNEVGAHCNQHLNGISLNFQSLGVCIGFDGDVEYPTVIQIDLLKRQIQDWQVAYKIPDDKVYLHREFATDKTCPGSLITKDWLKTLLLGNQTVLPTTPSKPNQCLDEKAIIESQKKDIAWYRSLIEALKSLLNKQA